MPLCAFAWAPSPPAPGLAGVGVPSPQPPWHRPAWGFSDPKSCTLEQAAAKASSVHLRSLRLLDAASGGLVFLRLHRGVGPPQNCAAGPRPPAHRFSLLASLAEHYKHHWFPEKPFKGSGYRCIRINHKMDPIISKAASQIGLSLPQLYQLLPSELTLWVDPYEVSYRIGEDGSICVLYEATATKPVSSYGMLTCKNQLMLGRTSPSKNYIMTVSS
ncbi:protein BTG2-like [Athene cunicularia]|uniref:protein BTG2-like n=1 Tax=Athene cunicularia TaxID=194338 RepID=UPI000EF737D5|nr:protein BTG2-like [Athene cunicularia]